MTAAGEVDDELDTLRAISREYSVTVRVLAVVIELLLAEVGGDTIEISDEALEDSPELDAWREPDRKAVAITTTRGEARHDHSATTPSS